MALTNEQALRIMSAGALLCYAHAALSDFEIEVVADAGYRWLRHGMEADVTDLEWPVIEDALAAMREAVRSGQVRLPTVYRIAA